MGIFNSVKRYSIRDMPPIKNLLHAPLATSFLLVATFNLEHVSSQNSGNALTDFNINGKYANAFYSNSFFK